MIEKNIESTGQLQQLLQTLGQSLVERESLLQLIVLSMIAGEHVLVLGPPGTAKSAAVRAISKSFNAKYFEYILGRFSEPNELFGPIDIRKLKDGSVETETKDMLPEADIAFLDEVFLGSTAILNTLLGLLNERRFKRGHTDFISPLRICVAASNSLPQDSALAAFADRFLVRVYVENLPDSELENLLKIGWQANQSQSKEHKNLDLRVIDELSEQVKNVDMSAILSHLAHAIRLIRKAGIYLSDRRIVKAQSLIAASAVLNNQSVASIKDLWPLIYVIATPQEQQHAREVLQDILKESANLVLPNAVGLASAGTAARSNLLLLKANDLLSEKDIEPSLVQAWQLKCEALLREIDSSFAMDALNDELKKARESLIHALSLDVPLSNE